MYLCYVLFKGRRFKHCLELRDQCLIASTEVSYEAWLMHSTRHQQFYKIDLHDNARSDIENLPVVFDSSDSEHLIDFCCIDCI